MSSVLKLKSGNFQMEITKSSIQHLRRATITKELVSIQLILITVVKTRKNSPTNKLESHRSDFLFTTQISVKKIRFFFYLEEIHHVT